MITTWQQHYPSQCTAAVIPMHGIVGAGVGEEVGGVGANVGAGVGADVGGVVFETKYTTSATAAAPTIERKKILFQWFLQNK